MEILEFGDVKEKKLVLVHGFQCPYSVLSNYINYYKKDFHIIVPILPGHNPKKKEEFNSLEDCVKEFEDFYTERYGNEIYAIYAMSFGGVFACQLWKNQKISVEKLILESSPLLAFGKRSISFMTRWYLKMSNKVRAGHKGTLKKVVKTMVPESYLEDFKAVVGNMSDLSIRNYISQLGINGLSNDIMAGLRDNGVTTKVVYFYGGKFSEFIFKGVGKFLKKNYKMTSVRKLKGKGHCEESLLHSEEWIFTLNQIL